MNLPPLNGWIILDKPLGITSAVAVGRVKRLLKPSKIGHGGTLDPLASGILPLALGEATKLFDYVAANEKAYRFTIHFGESRTTDDAEGEVTATSDVLPTPEQIQAILPKFIGEIQQVPPVFSALKINGKAAYARARAGEALEMAARPVQIYKLLFIKMESPEKAVLEVHCGKGTYVRSLARDIALALGSVGYVAALRRIKVGRWDESHAISLDSLEEMVHKSGANWLHPFASVLDDIPVFSLDAKQAATLRHGQVLRLPPQQYLADGLVFCVLDATPIGMVRAEKGQLRVVRNFNLA